MKEIAFIENVLRITSVLVREKYAERAKVAVTSKSEANDLLTETDLLVQDHIIEEIRGLFPHDLVAAEEGGFSRIPDDPAARCWVIDPIDGTQNFVRGMFPTFGISIAFAVGGDAVAGGVALPIPGDIFLAERGAGAFRNGQRLRVSEVASVGLARVEVDFSGRREREETLQRGSRLICEAGQVRCNCAAVVALCSIASGDMEAFFHVALNPWDYAAGQVIVLEAGGAASRLNGGPLRLFDGKRGVLASNGRIHQELLSVIAA
jgi:myo-inositol-1(or 4)-monophosphatase